MENNIYFSKNKHIKGLQRLKKSASSKILEDNIILSLNNKFEKKTNIQNKYKNENNFINGANFTPLNYLKNIRKINNNKIEEIVINTQNPHNKLYDYNKTTPLQINKKNKKYKLYPVKINIRKTKKNETLDSIQDSKEDEKNNHTLIVNYPKKKIFSYHFKEAQKSNVSDEKTNSLSIESSSLFNNTAKPNKQKRGINNQRVFIKKIYIIIA